MRRPVLVLAAVTLTAAGALTACGSTHAGSTGAKAQPDPQASASISRIQQEAEERRQRELAEADRKFPQVAKACAKASTAVPTPAPTAGSGESGGSNPENPKYAENHAFRQMVLLTDSQRCRGEAHAARITAAAARETPTDEAQGRALMTRLDYPGATLSAAADGVHFTLAVPGSGGCLTGILSGAGRIDVHGAYLEGGCEYPRGGH
ncbi:hypothetical protein ACFV1L_17150 [Kitasatospora sp. NPDC059646]|uniref:hypothetical protein n=1 Tax=Kitasatospora sp. NPDC059646 TaxID=3346893 RepID=UPI0036ABA7C8